MASLPPTFKQLQREVAITRKPSTCVGSTQKSERCGNPANADHKTAAKFAVDNFQIPKTGLITTMSGIAALCVCKRYHQGQATEIGARWAGEIQNTITHKYAQYQDRSLRSDAITLYARVDPRGSELAMLRDTSSAQRLQITNLSNQNTMLQDELAQAERLITTYEGGINVTNRTIKGLQEEKQDLQLQQIDLRKALEGSEATNLQLQDGLNATGSAVTRTGQNLKKEKERCAVVTVQSAELQAQQDTLLITLERLAAATVQKQNQFEILRRKATALEFEVETQKNQASTTEIDMKDLRSTNLLLQQTNHQLEGNTERLETLVQRLQTEKHTLLPPDVEQTASRLREDLHRQHRWNRARQRFEGSADPSCRNENHGSCDSRAIPSRV